MAAPLRCYHRYHCCWGMPLTHYFALSGLKQSFFAPFQGLETTRARGIPSKLRIVWFIFEYTTDVLDTLIDIEPAQGLMDSEFRCGSCNYPSYAFYCWSLSRYRFSVFFSMYSAPRLRFWSLIYSGITEPLFYFLARVLQLLNVDILFRFVRYQLWLMAGMERQLCSSHRGPHLTATLHRPPQVHGCRVCEDVCESLSLWVVIAWLVKQFLCLFRCSLTSLPFHAPSNLRLSYCPPKFGIVFRPSHAWLSCFSLGVHICPQIYIISTLPFANLIYFLFQLLSFFPFVLPSNLLALHFYFQPTIRC